MSNVKSGYTDLDMAAWTPGSYMIRDYAGAVEALRAVDATGQPLPIEKTDKDTWRVAHGKSSRFTVHYRVFCRVTNVRESYIDQERATLIPASIYLYPASADLPSTLTIEPYKTWTVISTALEPVSPADAWTFRVSGTDQLLDSPMEIGNHLVLRFDVDGTAHELAIQGQGNFDTTRLKADLSAIVRACSQMFGGNPNKRYVFLLNNTAGDYGGLEHVASTSMVYRRWGYKPENNYQVFLGLVSHEYFHLWLAKRIRPVEYSPITYHSEQYSRSLWVVEGFTQYYDDLLLRRAGLLSESSYLDIAASLMNNALNRPGDAVQSAAEASFDTWIKYYKGNENSSNSTVSYYHKGGLLALALDLEILASSQGKKRLDNVLQNLYELYKADPDRGFTEEEVQEFAEQAAGKDLDAFFRDYVYGTEPLDMVPYFDRIGVTLQDDGTAPQTPTFGAAIDAGTSVVQRVVRDQPAAEGGLLAGDEILAINGYRFKGDVTEWFNRTETGAPWTLLISRDGVLKTLQITPRPIPKHQYRLQLREDASEEQQALYRQWISLP
jgi:predicted metalloprotease with PDZ domain